jgi:hypothetical protein
MAAESWALPRVGDILLCLFPEDGTRRIGPKPRPALVIEVAGRLKPPRLRVCAGTHRHLQDLHPWEFIISPDNESAWECSGLVEPTKFSLKKITWLPFDRQFFTLPRGANSPKLGVLHVSLGGEFRQAAEAAGLL